MNVLPPQAPPSAPTATRTTCTPGGGAADAPVDFERLLADHVGGAAAGSPQPDPDGAAPDGDGQAPDEESGAVAAAVHAAVVAWRADPGDVGLGTHLRQVLQGTVEQVTATTTDAASAPTPEAAPAAGDLPVEASPSADPGPDAAVVATAEPAVLGEVEATGSTPGAVVARAERAADVPAAPARPSGHAAAADAAPGATAATTTSPAAAPAPAAVPADRAGVDTSSAATEPAATTGRRQPATDPTAPPADPVPTSSDGTADTAELLTGTRTEAAAASRTSAPATTSAVTPAATLDRVMRAVEALEHAPPPRRLSLEVEGVQLTVAMQGEEVTVAVRSGADSLAPGWQRDLATALRGRGLDLAADTGAGTASGRDGDERQQRPGTPAPRDTSTTASPRRSTQAAEPAGLRL